MSTVALQNVYLISIRDAFISAKQVLGRAHLIESLEFIEMSANSPFDEKIEIEHYFSRTDLYLYHVLTIWGDGIATYVVRESVQKRLHRLLLRVREFSLHAPASDVLRTFETSRDLLDSMGFPPGSTPHDREQLAAIDMAWRALSVIH